MISTIDTKTISGLLALRKNNMLTVNSEYQRGASPKRSERNRFCKTILNKY